MRLPGACLLIAAIALTTSPRVARAQTLDVPAELSVGPVPAAPGSGVQAMFVLGFFRGTPFNLDHARDILAGTSITPSFDRWCGMLPQVDFTNGTTVDSLGRTAPTTLCLPFRDPAAEQMQPCRPLPGLPTGTYSTGGGAVLRLRGWFAVRAPGEYTFAWGHDDGVAFDIGNLPVFAYPDGTAPRVDRRVLRFSRAGLYPFQLDWFDSIGGALIDWYVAPGEHPEGPLADGGFALVPTADLYPSDGLPCTADCQRCQAPTPRCDFSASRCVECREDRDCVRGRRCADGACVTPVTPDAGLVFDAGAPPDVGLRDAGHDAGLDAGAGAVTPAEGCGCTVGGSRSALAPGGALASILGVAMVRIRARRRRHAERVPRR